MSTVIEFGNDVPEPHGAEEVEITCRGDKITVRASDGQEIIGSARDWRTLAFYIIARTNKIVERERES